MANSAATTTQGNVVRARSTARRNRLFGYGTTLSVFAFARIAVEPKSLLFVSIASLGAVLAFAFYAYSEAKTWRHPMTQSHGLVMAIWWTFAFPVYLITTYHRRPTLLTALLVLIPTMDILATIYVVFQSR